MIKVGKERLFSLLRLSCPFWHLKQRKDKKRKKNTFFKRSRKFQRNRKKEKRVHLFFLFFLSYFLRLLLPFSQIPFAQKNLIARRPSPLFLFLSLWATSTPIFLVKRRCGREEWREKTFRTAKELPIHSLATIQKVDSEWIQLGNYEIDIPTTSLMVVHNCRVPPKWLVSLFLCLLHTNSTGVKTKWMWHSWHAREDCKFHFPFSQLGHDALTIETVKFLPTNYPKPGKLWSGWPLKCYRLDITLAARQTWVLFLNLFLPWQGEEKDGERWESAYCPLSSSS